MSIEYGTLLYELAERTGRSVREVAKRAGYTGGEKDQTLARLKRGEGSVKSALKVRQAIIELGVDVPPVPDPYDPESGSAAPDWRAEWIAIVDDLHELMPADKFGAELARLKKLANAYRIVRDGVAAISDPTDRSS